MSSLTAPDKILIERSAATGRCPWVIAARLGHAGELSRWAMALTTPVRCHTFEYYLGDRARHGKNHRKPKRRWRRNVVEAVEQLTAALGPDYVVLGGGNADKLHHLPPNCRLGDNANAFTGGFRLWHDKNGQITRAP